MVAGPWLKFNIHHDVCLALCGSIMLEFFTLTQLNIDVDLCKSDNIFSNMRVILTERLQWRSFSNKLAHSLSS